MLLTLVVMVALVVLVFVLTHVQLETGNEVSGSVIQVSGWFPAPAPTKTSCGLNPTFPCRLSQTPRTVY